MLDPILSRVAHFALVQLAPMLFGLKPVVLAIILGAVWRLAPKAILGPESALIAGAVMLMSFVFFL